MTDGTALAAEDEHVQKFREKKKKRISLSRGDSDSLCKLTVVSPRSANIGSLRSHHTSFLRTSRNPVHRMEMYHTAITISVEYLKWTKTTSISHDCHKKKTIASHRSASTGCMRSQRTSLLRASRKLLHHAFTGVPSRTASRSWCSTGSSMTSLQLKLNTPSAKKLSPAQPLR